MLAGFHSTERPNITLLTAAFDALSDAEAFGPYPSLYDMQQQLGTHGNLFVVYDPDAIWGPRIAYAPVEAA